MDKKEELAKLRAEVEALGKAQAGTLNIIQTLVDKKLPALWAAVRELRAEADERLPALEASMRELAGEARGRLKALEGAAAPAGAAAPPAPKGKPRRGRLPKTYGSWVAVKEAYISGVQLRDAARALGIPYSTACAYIKMAPDEVEGLKRKAEYARKLEALSEAEAEGLARACGGVGGDGQEGPASGG